MARARSVSRAVTYRAKISIYAGTGTSSIRAQARAVSLAALARLAARVLASRREHGAYPSSLAALDGEARDPLAAQPFILTRDAEGPYLASSAPDARELKLLWRLPEEAQDDRRARVRWPLGERRENSPRVAANPAPTAGTRRRDGGFRGLDFLQLRAVGGSWLLAGFRTNRPGPAERKLH